MEVYNIWHVVYMYAQLHNIVPVILPLMYVMIFNPHSYTKLQDCYSNSPQHWPHHPTCTYIYEYLVVFLLVVMQ